jgi:hypothetical protein
MPESFDFEREAIGGKRPLKGAVPLETIIGDSADRNPEIVSATPPNFAVRSQVLIGAGGRFQFFQEDSLNPPSLKIPANTLNGNVRTDIDFADEFYMVVPNVDSAKLVVLPLTDAVAPRVEHEIIPTGETAFIKLSHICFPPPHPRRPGDRDSDFRFHYMMLSSFSTSTLMGMPMPFILNLPGSELLTLKPTACDCAEARALPRPYDLDQFMD